MGFTEDKHSTNAMGGTELMKRALESRLNPDLLSEFQIFSSRVEEQLDPTKIRILYLHDLPEDPASSHLSNGGWKNFHKIVAVSNWQMQGFISRYNIPWERFVVMKNAIVPIKEHEKPTDKIRLGYWSTPHRGLELLVPVFEKLSEKHPSIELDVYSSFEIYGWGSRDDQYQSLFDRCKTHPSINYHGSVSNDDIRKALEDIHILAYPNIWKETSCITLMEAMSARCLCVHPNLGALYETSAGWTKMYQYTEDVNHHANLFYNILDNEISNYHNENTQDLLIAQKIYADSFYNWDNRQHQWNALLRSLINEPREIPQEMYTFSTF